MNELNHSTLHRYTLIRIKSPRNSGSPNANAIWRYQKQVPSIPIYFVPISAFEAYCPEPFHPTPVGDGTNAMKQLFKIKLSKLCFFRILSRRHSYFFFCSFITRCSNASNAFDHQRSKKSLAKDIFGSFIRMVFVSTKSFCPALDCCCPPGQRERERDVMSLGRQHANPLYAQHTSCRSSIHSQPGRLLSNEHKTNDTTTAMDRYEGTRRT